MAKVYEGSILTVNRENAVCRYLVEEGGRIVYVGNDLPSSSTVPSAPRWASGH